MKVTFDTFEKWGLEVTGLESVNGGSTQVKLWIVPVPICAMSYINDPRYLNIEKLRRTELKSKANVSFPSIPDRISLSIVADYRIQPIREARNITSGEELYIMYEAKYIKRP